MFGTSNDKWAGQQKGEDYATKHDSKADHGELTSMTAPRLNDHLTSANAASFAHDEYLLAECWVLCQADWS